jgi:hypothetical protein
MNSFTILIRVVTLAAIFSSTAPAATVTPATAVAIASSPPPATDPRNLSTGRLIPDESYCDQPYIVKTDDGHWLCVLTTSGGNEGASNQHVTTTRSADYGKTWSAPVRLERPGEPENSYAVLLKTNSGRVYCFYTFNSENLREVPRFDGKSMERRVDTLGQFVFRYSDDHGQSWSARRYVVPVREFRIDRENVTGGKVRFFWNVGRPLIARDGSVYVPLHKVGNWDAATFIHTSEGAFVRSPNIMTEADPTKLTWETLPDGDVGLRTPQPGGGPIAEEQSIVELSDGTLYCVYRSTDGHPVSTYSRDHGHTWTPAGYKVYQPGGLRFKHPRAANFVWKLQDGHYLYWFENHGGRTFADRNPAWLSAGREIDSPEGKRLEWTQPEILLYSDDPLVRISYPDLVEEGSRIFITETQKDTGRVHEIAPDLLAGLHGQFEAKRITRAGLLLELPAAGTTMPREVVAPILPALVERDAAQLDGRMKDNRAGFSLDLTLRLNQPAVGDTLVSTMQAGRGLALTVEAGGALRFTFSDGRTVATWTSDAGKIGAGHSQHVAVIVDGGPKLILFVIDGVLCDGGVERQFGWGRYSPHLQDAQGAPSIKIAPEVEHLRIYGRALSISEAVGNFRAGGP